LKNEDLQKKIDGLEAQLAAIDACCEAVQLPKVEPVERRVKLLQLALQQTLIEFETMKVMIQPRGPGLNG